MNVALAKTTIMTNLLILLHLCFKYISGTKNFDLYYTFYNCIFRICNSIYTFIFLLVQLISGHIDKSFNCLRGYKLNILNYFCFYLGFLSQPFTNHRTAWEAGGHFFNSSLPLPTSSQSLRY